MAAPRPSSPSRLLFLLPIALIYALVLLCYWPAVRGGLLWDDPAHITRPELRSMHGLWRIWTDLGATQQYYPVLHSAFWVESHLWGDATFGYHLLNILLHGTACWLFALVLRRLWSSDADGQSRDVLGAHAQPAEGVAWLAAVLFAVHPICVESVAWISEQKNTLSLVFYLLSVLAYFRFVGRRGPGMYAVATALFFLALGTKTVTATLPAALLVVLWWQRGRLAFRDDVLPLLPWFALALIGGATTAWVEKHFIGAAGPAFHLSPLNRVLLAGRVIWHYAAKLVWPGNLLFFYPRWDVARSLLPGATGVVAALALTVGLWSIRRRTRGPLAVWLLFVGGLFPALGFLDVYPFQFSYVADHFQYLANLPLIAGAAAVLTRIGLRRPVAIATLLVVGLCFVVLARRQAALYASNETLFRATLVRNPESWMAHDILGAALRKDSARSNEAIAEFRAAIRLRPMDPDAHFGLGVELAKTPSTQPEALAEYRRALQLRPTYLEAQNAIAVELAALGRTAEAAEHFEAALKLQPDFAEAQLNLADLFAKSRDRIPDALVHYEAALRSRPDYALAHANLANLLMRVGRTGDAINHYRAALKSDPELSWAHRNLAMALAETPGGSAEAIDECREALQLRPNDVETHNALAILYAQTGALDKARGEWMTALQIDPSFETARRNLQRLEGMKRRP